MAVRIFPIDRLKDMARLFADAVKATPTASVSVDIVGTFSVDVDRGAGADLGDAVEAISGAGGTITLGRQAEGEWSVHVTLFYEPAAAEARPEGGDR